MENQSIAACLVQIVKGKLKMIHCRQLAPVTLNTIIYKSNIYIYVRLAGSNGNTAFGSECYRYDKTVTVW